MGNSLAGLPCLFSWLEVFCQGVERMWLILAMVLMGIYNGQGNKNLGTEGEQVARKQSHLNASVVPT
jgi:hypothetical protein